MQIIRSLPVSPAAYIAKEFHTKIGRPPNCKLCRSPVALEALGYYGRSLTLARQIVQILIRRFRCRNCGTTTSILPSFAQPYRLVQNSEIHHYFETGSAPDDSPWKTILANYRRRFARWLPELRRALVTQPDRAPPFEAGHEAWAALRKALGDLERITEFLVSEFQITAFGRYRCHAVSAAPHTP
jgi:hypothetical protein